VNSSCQRDPRDALHSGPPNIHLLHPVDGRRSPILRAHHPRRARLFPRAQCRLVGAGALRSALQTTLIGDAAAAAAYTLAHLSTVAEQDRPWGDSQFLTPAVCRSGGTTAPVSSPESNSLTLSGNLAEGYVTH